MRDVYWYACLSGTFIPRLVSQKFVKDSNYTRMTVELDLASHLLTSPEHLLLRSIDIFVPRASMLLIPSSITFGDHFISFDVC